MDNRVKRRGELCGLSWLESIAGASRHAAVNRKGGTKGTRNGRHHVPSPDCRASPCYVCCVCLGFPPETVLDLGGPSDISGAGRSLLEAGWLVDFTIAVQRA